MTENKPAQPAAPAFPSWTFEKHCPRMVWNQLARTELTVGKDHLEDADLVILGVMDHELQGFAKTIDQGLHGALSELLEHDDDKKKLEKVGGTSPTIRVFQQGVNKTKRYALMSLGKTTNKDRSNEDNVGATGFALGKAIATLCHAEKKVSSARVSLPEATASNAKLLRDLSTGFYSEMYVDNRYRTGDNVVIPDEHLKLVSLVSEGPLADQSEIEKGKTVAKGIVLAKDIVNAPHNVLNSESLAETAQRVADASPCLSCRILNKTECQQLGMGAYLAVARGSETEPQFIHLTYRPRNGEVKRKVGLVGKGLLFDTGGHNIKTQMMELMKFDCGGSAAVLGAALVVGELEPPGVEVHFIVAACENMVSDRAFVPSDVLTAMNGLTIEVKNTDAEGRLTLADALVFADREVGCEKILEMSTLTGGCMVALGKDICGVFTDNDEFAAELADVSRVTGEKAWRLPLVPEYKEHLKSSIADLNNLGTRWGGSIHAALFLQHFVDKGKPFAHVDMAGPVWNEKLGVSTGFGVKMMTEWVTRQGQSNR